MMKKQGILYIVIIAITILVLVVIFQEQKIQTIMTSLDKQTVEYKENQRELNELKADKEKLNDDLNKRRDINKKLESINSNMTKLIEDITIVELSNWELKIEDIEDDNALIIQDLFTHPELIPHEGVLGGKMYFSKVYLLNKNWVYSIYEDGHIQGFALFRYHRDKNNDIVWKLIDSFLLGEL